MPNKYVIAADFGGHGIQFLCRDDSWAREPNNSSTWHFASLQRAESMLRVLNLPPSAQVIQL